MNIYQFSYEFAYTHISVFPKPWVDRASMIPSDSKVSSFSYEHLLNWVVVMNIISPSTQELSPSLRPA